jgi:hypothetical protein
LTVRCILCAHPGYITVYYVNDPDLPGFHLCRSHWCKYAAASGKAKRRLLARIRAALVASSN